MTHLWYSHMDKKNWWISWNTSTAYPTTFSSPWTLRWPPPFRGHKFYIRPEQPTRLTSTWMKGFLTIQQTSNLWFHLTKQGQNHLCLGQPPSWTRHIKKDLLRKQLQHETDPPGSQPNRAANHTIWKGTHGSDLPALCLKYLQPHNMSIKGVLCPKWKLLL